MRSGIFVQLHGVMDANACMFEHVVHEATSRSSLKSRIRARRANSVALVGRVSHGFAKLGRGNPLGEKVSRHHRVWYVNHLDVALCNPLL